MSDHLLILTDQEVSLLGTLYSLGAMAAMITGGGLGAVHTELYEGCRDVAGKVLDLKEVRATQEVVRQKIARLLEELHHDAEREKPLG